jgi:hypothetical protein
MPGGPYAEPSRFTVAAAGDTVVMLDTASGKTWMLHRTPGGGAAWLPVERIDDPEAARKWRDRDQQPGFPRGMVPPGTPLGPQGPRPGGPGGPGVPGGPTGPGGTGGPPMDR